VILLIRGEHAFEGVHGGEHHLGKSRAVGLPNLQRENVFEFMRDFTELLETASRGITL